MINGGFFILDPAVLRLVEGDGTIWENQPLETLAATGQLAAWVHETFWQPMDTLRDKQRLADLWESGAAPWMVWEG
jgi:glucose-1-phosphate cytidylyltransferase